MKLALLTGLMGMAWCGDNHIKGTDNFVLNGKNNKIKGKKNTVDGWENKIYGNFNQIKGDKNEISGKSNLIDGNGNMVIGDGNIVMGQVNIVNDDFGININTNWGKYLKSEKPTPQIPNPSLGGMNMAIMMNQGMRAHLQEEIMEKMRMEMQMTFNQIREHQNAELNFNNLFGRTKKGS